MMLTFSGKRERATLAAFLCTVATTTAAAMPQIATSGTSVAPRPQASPCSQHFCPAPLTEVSGHASADNFHALYSATCEGTNMVVTQHAPTSGTGCVWNLPATYSFTTPNRYIYIAAWSDDGVAQGLLHDLTFNGEQAFSGSPAWRVYATGNDRDFCNQAPTTAEMKTWISTACSTNAWAPTITNGPANTAAGLASWGLNSVWGPVTATSPQAQWTWFNSGLCGGASQPFASGCNHNELLIFRLQVNVVRGYVSADNYFNIYTADDEVATPRLTYRGGGCNWTTPTPICFTTIDRYIYVLGWSDLAVRQGLIHDLRHNGMAMFSDDPGWTVAPTGVGISNCASINPVVVAAQVWAAVSGSTWAPTSVGVANGTLWPFLPCISSLARWTWYESGACPDPNSPFAPGCDHGEFLIFRHELFNGCGC